MDLKEEIFRIPVEGGSQLPVILTGVFPSSKNRNVLGYFRLRVGPIELRSGRLVRMEDGSVFVSGGGSIRHYGGAKHLVQTWTIPKEEQENLARIVKARLSEARDLQAKTESGEEAGGLPPPDPPPYPSPDPSPAPSES